MQVGKILTEKSDSLKWVLGSHHIYTLITDGMHANLFLRLTYIRWKYREQKRVCGTMGSDCVIMVKRILIENGMRRKWVFRILITPF